MANELNELNPVINENGRDINVIEKQVTPKIGTGTYVFIVFLFILGIIPGLYFLWRKTQAFGELQSLQQKIQHNASQIDNYLEQRVQILQNVVGLVEKSVNLDKETFTQIAAFRSGMSAANSNDQARNEMVTKLDKTVGGLTMAFENYPELRSQNTIMDAMQQNSYLQREITAARELYNDTVYRWNNKIFQWPTYRFVAFKNGYTTRIPFTASKEVKQQARQVFFK